METDGSERFTAIKLDYTSSSLRDGLYSTYPTSHSGGPGFDSRPLPPAILIEILRVFPKSHQTDTGIVGLKIRP